MLHQALVSRVVVTHGGHKDDILALRMPLTALGRQLLGCG